MLFLNRYYHIPTEMIEANVCMVDLHWTRCNTFKSLNGVRL